MARPRTPSNILELRGAFRAHPERAREDAPGAAPFNRDPPAHLPMPTRRAWAYVVARLPQITLTSSDELCIEQCARTLAAIWSLESRMGELAGSLPESKRMNDSLVRLLGELGMTPRSRTTFAAAPRDPAANPFAALRDMDDAP